jgi:nucleotide-binding universal stress UspA family protein
MVSSIALLTDFSSASKVPFRAASELARGFRCPLHVLFVEEGLPVFADWELSGGPILDAAAREDLRGRLNDLVKGEPAFAGLDARPRVLYGSSAAAVTEFQESEGVEFLVLATHGYTGLKRFLLGSFASKLLRVAVGSVLLFPARDEVPAAQSFPPRRILLCHDFSPASERALAPAQALARTFGAQVRLLFVVEEQSALYAYAARMDKTFDEYKAEVEREARRRLEAMIGAEWQGVEAEASTRFGAAAAAEVLAEAAAWGADLLVVASSGRSGLSRWLLGSVAEKVVQGAKVPVLVVKEPRGAR